MKKIKISTLIFGILLMISCQNNLKYWVDYELDVDFSQYYTYSIDDQCSDYNPGVNPINQQRIKNAIEIELTDMGYTRSDDPDLMIKFFVKDETKFFYEQCLPFYEGYRDGGRCVDRILSYKVGTLVIDLIDVRKDIAVWHGGGEGNSWENIKNPDKEIRKMVKAVMYEYKKVVKPKEFAQITK